MSALATGDPRRIRARSLATPRGARLLALVAAAACGCAGRAGPASPGVALAPWTAPSVRIPGTALASGTVAVAPGPGVWIEAAGLTVGATGVTAASARLGRDTTGVALGAALARARGDAATLNLYADDDAPLGLVADVLDAARRAGYRDAAAVLRLGPAQERAVSLALRGPVDGACTPAVIWLGPAVTEVGQVSDAATPPGVPRPMATSMRAIPSLAGAPPDLDAIRDALEALARVAEGCSRCYVGGPATARWVDVARVAQLARSAGFASVVLFRDGREATERGDAEDRVR